MSKKLTFIFIATIIITLVLVDYFIIQGIRGAIQVGPPPNPANLLFDITRTITGIYASPSANSVFIKSYFTDVDALFLKEPPTTGTNYEVSSWCAVQYFSWCSGGYPEPPPEPECGDGTCDPEEEGICLEDCPGGEP